MPHLDLITLLSLRVGIKVRGAGAKRLFPRRHIAAARA